MRKRRMGRRSRRKRKGKGEESNEEKAALNEKSKKNYHFPFSHSQSTEDVTYFRKEIRTLARPGCQFELRGKLTKNKLKRHVNVFLQ
jgi:hypothetical protein